MRRQVPTLPKLLKPPSNPAGFGRSRCRRSAPRSWTRHHQSNTPLLHPFPPDDAPSAASEVLPLPKRHRGLQQTFPAPHLFPGCTDVLRQPPRLPLANALPDDNPRSTQHDGNQLSWRHPATCPDPLARLLLDRDPALDLLVHWPRGRFGSPRALATWTSPASSSTTACLLLDRGPALPGDICRRRRRRRTNFRRHSHHRPFQRHRIPRPTPSPPPPPPPSLCSSR